MKIGIYSPYLDTLGGGERYMMTLAEHWQQQGHEVDIFWNNPGVREDTRERFGLGLNRVKFVEDIFSSRTSFYQKWQITRKYELILYLSDGSLPFLFAKKNVLHFQVPFHGVGGRRWLNKAKLKRITKIVCNSKFTKRFIDQEYGVKSEVIYPPVEVESFKPGKKGKVILYIGRFTDLLHNKRQDVLVSAFKKMLRANKNGVLNGWKLVLAGSDREGKKLVAKLRKEAKSYPIEIETNVDLERLNQLYGQAKIFWVASGFGVDEDKEPEKTEHFGISVAEAMAAGCLPVVVKKGGIPEIVRDKNNGLWWKDKEDLEKITIQLIKAPSLIEKLSTQAIKDSRKFSRKRFCQEFDELIRE